MTAFKSNFITGIPVFLLTILIFFLTKNPLTGSFKLQFLLASLVVLAGFSYFLKRRMEPLAQSRKFIYSLVIFVLFLVGATGWFFSPFFFTLYLLAIMLSFVFPLPIPIAFVLTLTALFSFNVGEVDLAYDYLVVLSLLTTIPLSIYLRKEYLRLKEVEKDILVLEKEKRGYQSKVEEVLANTVNNFAVNLRQPINDVKQLGYYLKHQRSQKGIDKYRDRIIASSEEAIRMLNDFEEQVTGKKLLSKPQTSLSRLPADQD